MLFQAYVVLAILAILAGAGAVFLFSLEWLRTRKKAHTKHDLRERLGACDVEGGKDSGAARVLANTSLGPVLKRREERRRTASFERDLPALIEVVALGMHAGMGFDQAFALYTERFDTPLAQCCRESLAVWQRGLRSRDEGMRQLADRIGTTSFRHFCSSALRALRFGAPMTQLLLDLAREARVEYRAKRQELVAKAPVKMLLPTGILILPAMLLLVMGPIVLDLMRKMG